MSAEIDYSLLFVRSIIQFAGGRIKARWPVCRREFTVSDARRVNGTLELWITELEGWCPTDDHTAIFIPAPVQGREITLHENLRPRPHQHERGSLRGQEASSGQGRVDRPADHEPGIAPGRAQPFLRTGGSD